MIDLGTWSLRELHVRAEHNLLRLPAFQRSYVWDIGKAEKLFDSLIREIPIGNLTLAIPTFPIGVADLDLAPASERGRVPDFTFAELEDFEKAAKKAQHELGTRVDSHLVLDGQQRITTIYRVLRGVDVLHLAVSDAIEEFRSFGQIRKGMESVSSESDTRCMHLPLAVAFNVTGKSDEELGKVFEATGYGRYLAEHAPDRVEEERARFHRLMRTLGEQLYTKPVLTYCVAEAGQDDLIKFFERSNTLGKPLDFFDLLNAKTFDVFGKTKKRSFRGALDKAVRAIPHDQKVPKFEEHFIRVRCFEELDAMPKVGNPLAKNTILEHARGNHIEPYFDRWINDFTRPISYLQDRGLTTYHDTPPFPLMAVPTFFFLKEFGFRTEKIRADIKEFFDWWYWASVFSERYSYRTNEAAQEDIELLRGVAQGKKVVAERYVDKLSNRLHKPEQVLALTASRGHYQRAILQLGIYLYDSRDLFTGTSLRSLPMLKTKRGKPRKIDLHHIYPQKLLTARGVDRALLHSLCNVMYASDPAHRGMDGPPGEYLSDADRVLDPTALETHFCSAEIAKKLKAGELDDDFEAFLRHRAEQMTAAITKVAGDDVGRKVAAPFAK